MDAQLDRDTGNGPSNLLGLDAGLLGAVITGTVTGLEMTGVVPTPVGANRLAISRHALTVMVGLVGKHSGNLALNLSESGTLHLASSLMGSDYKEISEETIDAIMEVGNMVAGAIKGPLMGSAFEISNISLPSLVFGNSYNMVYARGISTVSVEFEIPGMPFVAMNSRFFSTTISLLRASGSKLG